MSDAVWVPTTFTKDREGFEEALPGFLLSEESALQACERRE